MSIEFFESESIAVSWGHIPIPALPEKTSDFVRGYFAYQKPIQDIIQPQFNEAL